jgi:hypothetical protein
MACYLLGLGGAAVWSGFKALSAAAAGQLSQQQVTDEMRHSETILCIV